MCTGEHQPTGPARLAQGLQQFNGEGAILVRVVGPKADEKWAVCCKALGPTLRQSEGRERLDPDSYNVCAPLRQQVLGQRITTRVLGEEDRLIGPGERQAAWCAGRSRHESMSRWYD